MKTPVSQQLTNKDSYEMNKIKHHIRQFDK